MYRHFFKRVFDIVFVVVALVLVGWLIVLVAIWLHFANKGAGAFFMQDRPGKNGKTFRVIKFKTMSDECDEQGNLLPDAQRMTKVGRFVRAVSLDELPQLFNVLVGDMSLIGPRPLLVQYLPLYTPEQYRRHEVRPGITGWAQVHGRNHCKLSAKFELDVWYVDHCSLILDLKILFLTVQNVVLHKDVGEGAGDMEEIDDLHFIERLKEMETQHSRPQILREIGSNFWLNPEDKYENHPIGTPERFHCPGSDYVWLSTGRSAIAFVIEEIERRNPDVRKLALIPPYTCYTVIKPFLSKGYELVSYQIDENFRTNAASIVEMLEKMQYGVLLIHRYFGFDTLDNKQVLLDYLSRHPVATVEDCTQCLYSDFERLPFDYQVASIRKWCAVPDGAFAVCKKGTFQEKPTEQNELVRIVKCEAAFAKYEYLFNGIGDKADFLRRYRMAEEMLDSRSEKYAISDFSVKVQTNIDVDRLINKRKSNYDRIISVLSDLKVVELPFSRRNPKETPLYCPVVVENRDDLQQLLANNDIYAPIVWPKADCCPSVCPEADYLYEHLLCLPIDQRYGEFEMDRILDVIMKNDD